MGKHKKSEGRMRFPKYLEERHEDYLNKLKDIVTNAEGNSPFADYEDIDIDAGFFGAGYVLSSFPSLYDMYGKFMAGLDIEYLFNQAFEDTTNGPVIDKLVSEQATLLSDDLENEAIPRYEVGMRDINAVMSGTFVVGKAMLERKRTQELSRFDAELRYKMIPVAVERWKTHLDWNKQVVSTYSEILKLYFMSVLDIDDHNHETHSKDILWPFTVNEYYRIALGALTGNPASSGGVAGASHAQKALGGAMSGAASGAMVGGPWGAGIGGILGIGSGFL